MTNHFTAGSSQFVKLAQKGYFKSLEEFVFTQSNPYINHVPKADKLAQNALIFFCINNHKEAIQYFFKESKFAEILTIYGGYEAIKNLIYSDNISLWKTMLNIPQWKFSFEHNTIEALHLICEYCAIDILTETLPLIKKSLSKSEELKCFLSTIDKGITKNKNNQIRIIQKLEEHFIDFNYHRDNDSFMQEIIKYNNMDIAEYLLFNKKIRISKTINILSYGSQDLARLIEKRKLNDKLERKMSILDNRLNINSKISTKTKI